MKLRALLQSQGFGSRREVEKLIHSGAVFISGKRYLEPKLEVGFPDEIEVSGTVVKCMEKIYVALNKPAGYECSHSPQHHKSVYELLPETFINRSISSAGRLDQDTTGLLLFSDDGDFIHRTTSPKSNCHKTYRVLCAEDIDSSFTDALCSGVMLRDDPKPAVALSVQILGEREFLMTIGEGRYHQVKRMVAALSNRVEKLHRESFGGVLLSELNIALGEWCYIDRLDVL